jgi:predicted DNA-binding transcriptional regulator AlpA
MHNDMRLGPDGAVAQRRLDMDIEKTLNELRSKLERIEQLMEERRPARLLKLPDVAERVGLSPSSFLKGVKESGFPAGFKHGNNRLWLESEVGSRC